MTGYDGDASVTTFVAVHGHFYQPPREDPFTGMYPPEPGAEPYRNFCEKINVECYRPNAEIGNFRRISFDVGPTLAEWLDRHDPATHDAIAASDRWFVRQHGVGNAMAQAHSHTILPLASRQEKRIQVAWGIADFQRRFGRKPEGMWLPETAVDHETLDVMAEQGIGYTVLAPWQADAAGVDPTSPYRVNLPSGRSIVAFFYDAPLSGATSFNQDLTVDAGRFTHHHLLACRNHAKLVRGEPQIILVATDGELYGHHQPFRDHFLAYLLREAAPRAGIGVTTPGLFLHRYPVLREVRIREETSWSCGHGVRRWHGDCSCTDGDGTWKWHLRHALNRLAAHVDLLFEREVARYLPDPWRALENYLDVHAGILTWQTFIACHGGPGDRALVTTTRQPLQTIFEAAYHRHVMYTSCAYFFEDLDRLEPRVAIAHAARAIDLLAECCEVDLAGGFQTHLAQARSDRTWRTGADLYRDILARHRPVVTTLRQDRAPVLVG